MMLYMENCKEFSLATRKLLELINEFGKVVEYKINIEKCVVVLYTNKWEGYSKYFGDPEGISTARFLTFYGLPLDWHGTCGCVI